MEKLFSEQARYRYVLQAMILDPEGKVFLFLHEFINLHNPQTEKAGASRWCPEFAAHRTNPLRLQRGRWRRGRPN